MKNKSKDLNNHLFAQMERLCDEGLTGEKLKSEIQRAKATSSIASSIIENASLQLKAEELYSNKEVSIIPDFIAIEGKE